MLYLLNFAYLLLIAVAFPWFLYQRLRSGKYRDGWRHKLWGSVPSRNGHARCLWLHAVSVGEVNLLQPLIERWEARYPDWDVVISTTTQAGFQLAKSKYAPRRTFYAPLDFSWAVRRAVERIRPDLLVLTELELWPNLVAIARRHGAKVAVVNGRLSERSFRGYQRIGWLVRRILTQIDLLAVQNDEYGQRFLALGARAAAVHVTGSVKFDGARIDRQADDVCRLAAMAGIREDDVVFLAGSTQAPEEAFALAAFRRLSLEYPNLRLVLVPRHPERFNEVADLLDRSGIPWRRRSALAHAPLGPAERPIVLVDAVGELGWWWGTAQIAFVGGSLTSRGGQNMIEPSAYGCAVSFGPNTWNFRDAASLLTEGNAAVVVSGAEELETFVRRCLAEPDYASGLGQRARQLVLEQQGAANRTIELLSQLVPATGGRRHDRQHTSERPSAVRPSAASRWK